MSQGVMDDMDAETAAAFCIFIFFMTCLGMGTYSLYNIHTEQIHEMDRCFDLLQDVYGSNSTSELNHILNQQIQSYEKIPSSVNTVVTNVINERCST